MKTSKIKSNREIGVTVSGHAGMRVLNNYIGACGSNRDSYATIDLSYGECRMYAHLFREEETGQIVWSRSFITVSHSFRNDQTFTMKLLGVTRKLFDHHKANHGE